jgi:hypothetical protein
VKVAVSFRHHGELDVLVDTVQVVKEVSHIVWSVWPDDESAHVKELVEGLTGDLVERHLLEIFHEVVGFARR